MHGRVEEFDYVGAEAYYMVSDLILEHGIDGRVGPALRNVLFQTFSMHNCWESPDIRPD